MPTILRASRGNPLAQPVFRTLVAMSAAAAAMAAGLMGANAAQAGTVPPNAGLAWDLGPPPPLPPLPSVALGPPTARMAAPQPVQRASSLVWELDPEPVRPLVAQIPGDAAVQRASALVWELDSEPVLPLVLQIPGEAGVPLITAGAIPPPLVGLPVIDPFPPPNLGGGMPSAYIANWGDYFIGASAGTPGKLRGGVVDGSVNMGLGLGDAYRLIAVELDWNIGSTKNFNANGGFDVLVSRMLVSEPRLQVVVGGGTQGLYQYGNESKPPSNLYGVLTVATPLRTPNPYFNQVLQLSAGIGGNNFAALDENFDGANTAFFTALGLEITSNVGLSLGYSGRGANVNVSYTPFRELPFTVNVLAADVFNSSPFGTVGVLSVSWGDNFRTGLF